MSNTELTREHIVWAYRVLLDRDPESEDAIQPKLRAWRTTAELRADIMASGEFRIKNPDHAQTHRSTIVIKPLASGARLLVDLADHVIGLPIVRDEYEQQAIAFARSVLGEGDIAVDVGAHIGFFTIEMAQAVGETGHVYAFEPLERNAQLLERSVNENRFNSRVTVERAAVARQSGIRTLRFARETLNTGGAFLSEAAIDGLGALASSPVRTMALDDCVARAPVRLLKMDVEGAEPLVIAGARTLLSRDRPVILSEVHPEQLQRVSGTTPRGFLEQLGELGFEPHHLVEGQAGAAVAPDEINGVMTVAFLPRGLRGW